MTEMRYSAVKYRYATKRNNPGGGVQFFPNLVSDWLNTTAKQRTCLCPCNNKTFSGFSLHSNSTISGINLDDRRHNSSKTGAVSGRGKNWSSLTKSLWYFMVRSSVVRVQLLIQHRVKAKWTLEWV